MNKIAAWVAAAIALLLAVVAGYAGVYFVPPAWLHVFFSVVWIPHHLAVWLVYTQISDRSRQRRTA